MTTTTVLKEAPAFDNRQDFADELIAERRLEAAVEDGSIGK